MRCPKCGSKTRIKSTRPLGLDKRVRLRQCKDPDCAHEFKTKEERAPEMVAKYQRWDL